MCRNLTRQSMPMASRTTSTTAQARPSCTSCTMSPILDGKSTVLTLKRRPYVGYLFIGTTDEGRPPVWRSVVRGAAVWMARSHDLGLSRRPWIMRPISSRPKTRLALDHGSEGQPTSLPIQCLRISICVKSFSLKYRFQILPNERHEILRWPRDCPVRVLNGQRRGEGTSMTNDCDQEVNLSLDG